jgi:glycosyltransferase involved in cell wall biosynthesis
LALLNLRKNPIVTILDGPDYMKILALEPYYGGSHRAFLDGLVAHSRHEWEILSLPPHHWKWRMRHAAATFARELQSRTESSEYDFLFATSMLNLAEFRGLAPASFRSIPTVLYFHENQLTYPVQNEDQRDLHFAMTHLVSIETAHAVWFNSAFHRDEFLTAAQKLLRRMPDDSLRPILDAGVQKCQVQYPGIKPQTVPKTARPNRPIRILWAARWEFDKNPETFFEAIGLLKERGVDFRLNVIGEQFDDCPTVFEKAKDRFADHIDRWGYQPSSEAYQAALAESDLFVSTADHEFFGLSTVEAIDTGARPLLPRRLAYPELLAPIADADDFFYDGTATELADRITNFAKHPDKIDDPRPREAIARFHWDRRAAEIDSRLDEVANPR